ncbi:MAG TPA: ABC transporter permease [Anaerolineales bacterium]|nr:ABC transporter permease [Anaerolineales bacterium]
MTIRPGVLARLSFRYLVRRPWQSVLMVLGITLGVAVVIAVDLANESAARAFDLSADAVAGRATHNIAGASGSLDEAVYTDLKLAGLAVAIAPVVTAYVASPELGGLPLQLLGIDPFAEGAFRSFFGSAGDRAAFPELAGFLTQPGAILIARDLAERYGFSDCTPERLQTRMVDCSISIEIEGRTEIAVIAGLLEPGDDLTAGALSGIILADISTAQEITGRTGYLSYIDVILPPEDACPGCRDNLERLLPEGAALNDIAARTDTIAEMTTAFRLNLTALSLLALVVGLFLIYNTMTFSVVKRRALFGTLRCLGVTGREIFRMVVAEALLVGIVGTALGTLAGILLGQEAVRLVSRSINDLYFVVTVRDVGLPAISLAKGWALGILATVGTAVFPAREAGSVPARAALSRADVEESAGVAVRFAAAGGAAAILAGAGLLAIPSGLGWSFAGTFTIMIGFAALTPAVTVLLMRAASALFKNFGPVVRMAPRNVTAALSRTSIAVAALMVAVAVTIGISLMVSSFRATVVDWLDETIRGDVYLSVPGVSATQPDGVINPAVVERLDRHPDVARLDVLRVITGDSPYGPIRIGATNNPLTGGNRRFAAALGPPEQVQAAMAAGAVILSEPLARRLEIPFQGGSIRLQTPAGERDFAVAGVYYDYGNPQGILLMDLARFRETWGDEQVTAISVILNPGVDPEAATVRFQNELVPIQRLQIQPNRALRDGALVVFDRTFAITTALQGLATLVAFIGVLSALMSLQLEKARELGVLRAVGMTARQLRQLVLLETGLMGAVAGVLSIPTGIVLSLILIYIINRRAFGWTLQFQFSFEPLVQALGIAVIAAVLAGLYPALRSGRMAAAAALRGE